MGITTLELFNFFILSFENFIRYEYPVWDNLDLITRNNLFSNLLFFDILI